MRLVLPKLTSIQNPDESLISDATANHFSFHAISKNFFFFFRPGKIIENIYRAKGSESTDRVLILPPGQWTHGLMSLNK